MKVRTDDVPLTLLDLPWDILTKAIPSLMSEQETIQVFNRLTNTCHQAYSIFQPELDKPAAKQLLQYVLTGQADKAKKMYLNNPRLLFIEATAEEYAAGLDNNDKAVHRIVVASPFQAALGAGDVRVLAEMAPFCDHSLAKQQYIQQLPNGFRYPASTYDFSPLADAISRDNQLIQTSHPNDATKALLSQFRMDFIPKTVKTGHHFNLNDLVNACEVYHRHWLVWKSHQVSFFWCQVIGCLQRLASVCDAEVFSKGLVNAAYFTFSKFPLLVRNSLTRNIEEYIAYFPLDLVYLHLGRDFAIDRFGTAAESGRNEQPVGHVALLKEYVNQKTANFEMVIARLLGLERRCLTL